MSAPLRDIFFVFLKIGTFALGGAYSMLSFFQREVVAKRGWLTEDEFSEGVAVGQITPGPPIVNTGSYIGYRLRGLKGAAVTVIALVLPGFIIILGLGWLYLHYGNTGAFRPVLKGLGASVVGLLLSVVYRMGGQLLKNAAAVVFALTAFVLLLFFNVNPILLILAAGLIGRLVFRKAKHEPS
jgi:chromate transporter